MWPMDLFLFSNNMFKKPLHRFFFTPLKFHVLKETWLVFEQTNSICFAINSQFWICSWFLDSRRGATDHPIHMHGHSFHVLKIAFPDVNITTGLVTKFTQDIQCLDVECRYSLWANEDWANGNIPGLNLDNPPLKDTVVVPRGGYVVIRLYLQNPGMKLVLKLIHSIQFSNIK